MQKSLLPLLVLMAAQAAAAPPPRKLPLPAVKSAGVPVAERAARREQALAQLDDPDPILRLSVMEDILQSPDALLKSLALRKALSSSDTDLRQTALRSILSRPTPFVFTIERCGNIGQNAQNNDFCGLRMARLGNSFNLFFDNMDATSGELRAYATSSGKSNQAQQSRYARVGRLTGTTLQFQLLLEVNGRLGGDCSATLKLNGQRMEGRISCDGAEVHDGGFQLL